MTKPILDPDLVYKLVGDIFETYLEEDRDEYLMDTLVALGLLKKVSLTEEDMQDHLLPFIEEYDMDVGDEYYTYTLEEITEKLQAKEQQR